MWDKPPHAEIIIGGTKHFAGAITGTEEKPDVIEFTHELTEGDTYEMVIHRSGKTAKQTVVNEKGDLLKDQLLHIKNIEIDEIDIGALVFEGVYRPEYPEPWFTQQRELGHEQPETLKNVTCMGHNGTWTFKFTSPFYMWLLENLY
jgi:hypothetical protein